MAFTPSFISIPSHSPIPTRLQHFTRPNSSPPNKIPAPITNIPGHYGLPLVGPFKDRLDYFYNQGCEEFFRSRVRKYNSTVFRVNMPPGPFITHRPRVIALLDGKSFPVLFDVSKVEKRDLFTGTYMPSTNFTGGYRVLSYLDPSEPNHAKLKNLLFTLLKNGRNRIIPEFRTSFQELFDALEGDIKAEAKASFGDSNDQACFNFLARSLYGTDPANTALGKDGPGLVAKWVLAQLGPLLTLGLPKYVEDLVLHTVPLPPCLVRRDYERLYDFFYQASASLLDEAEELGIKRDEACHNLLFATCFNSFGGMKIFFSTIMKWIGRGGPGLHGKLAREIRSAVGVYGQKVTMEAIEMMPLTISVVHEVQRIEPPVPMQYGRAKRDIVIESHERAYKVREGEMLFGYQPFATRDPKIFERAEEFVADRFVGGEGEKLLKHVLWSNGPEDEGPTVKNKQCAGKDFVNLVSVLFVVELFLRYDSFSVEVGSSALGSSILLTNLKKATS